MVNRFAKFGVMSLILGCAAFASAQVDTKTLTIRAGVFLPANGDAADNGKTWTSLGADVKVVPFAINSKSTNGYYSVSLDYYEKNDWRSIPLTINYNVVEGKLVYFGGLGVSSTKIAGAGERLVSTGTVGATYELGAYAAHDFTFTAKYFFTSRAEFNGFGFYVGVKL